MAEYKGKTMTQKRINELKQAKTISGEERYNRMVRGINLKIAQGFRNKIDEMIRGINNDN